MKSSYAAIVAIVVVIIVIAGAVAVYRSRGSSASQSPYHVSVSISPSSQNGSNGATLTYTVTVHNTGSVSDSYSLTVDDNPTPVSENQMPSWNPIISPVSLLNVPTGGSGTATLSVTIPSVAVSGWADSLEVTATGTEDSAVDICTAGVSGP